MPGYIEKKVIAGNVIVIHKYFSIRYGKKAGRGTNIKATSEKQKERNARMAKDRDVMYIAANFEPGDYYITFTYRPSEGKNEFIEAHKNFTAFFQKVKRGRKDIKCVASTEETANGNYHHHAVISGNADLERITKLWKWGHLNVQKVRSIDDLRLAEYIVKGVGSNHRVIRSKIFKTRNLIKPLVVKRVIRANSFRREPKPVKGYEIIKGSLINYDDELGFPAQRYVMRRL